MNNIYTIGYAQKEPQQFLRCLKKNGINCVIDVRTSPYSGSFPEYNKERIAAFLKNNGILYLHFGKEFGARREELEVYRQTYSFSGVKQEQVHFDAVRMLDIFNSGYNRVIDGYSKGFTCCFMCSEKYPYNCHRFILVASTFPKTQFNVINVIDENSNMSFDETINHLLIEKRRQMEILVSRYNTIGSINLFETSNQFGDDFESWASDIFLKIGKADSPQTALEFGNLKIGYVKGTAEEND